MKQIRLKSSKLNFFKGTIEREVNYGHNTNIFAENEGEKTTIFDSVLWGLFGKDSNNKTESDFEIKTYCTPRTKWFFKDLEIGDVAHNLNHSVEHVLDIDGTELILKRTYKETWVKKTNKMTGHTTVFEIDGLSVQKKVYTAKVEEIIDEKLFRLLTDAKFFNSKNYAWTDRRNILMELGGGDEETEIEGYDLVKDILNGRTSDDQKKHIKAQKKKINEQLITIEPKIEENTRMIVEVTGDKTELEKKISDNTIKKTDLENHVKDMKSDSGADDRRKEIASIDTLILEKKNEFNQAKQIKLAEIQEKGNTLRNEESICSVEIHNLADENGRIKSLITENEKKKSEILGEWKVVNSTVDDVDKVCPTCKQNLPVESIQKTIETLNIKRANRLEELNYDGLDIVEKIKQLEAQQISPDKIISANNSLDECKKKIEEVSAEYRTENEKAADVSELEYRKDAIGSPEASPANTMAIENDIIAIESLIEKSKKSILDIENNQKNRDRIKELEDDQERLGLEFAKLEKELTLTEEFTVAKVHHIEETVNGLFSIARFKMFKKLVNGGIEDCCETLKDGVPYNSINNAGELQVGADICNTLQGFHGVSLPMWYDNRESVTNMPDVNCQTVSLYVSPEDTTMWIGTPEERKKYLIEKAKKEALESSK